MTSPELPTHDQMQELMVCELEACPPEVREGFAPLRVDLRIKVLKWEYGYSEPFQAWVFAEMGEREVIAVYCVGGHGAHGSPWGIVFERREYFGMDSGWYRSLRELLAEWDLGT